MTKSLLVISFAIVSVDFLNTIKPTEEEKQELALAWELLPLQLRKRAKSQEPQIFVCVNDENR